MAVQLDDEVKKVVEEKIFTKAPPLYRVILLNDDYTPMDFVVMILENIFQMSSDKAVQIMLSVHHDGRCRCGVYPKDIAATKVSQVMLLARQNQYPLHCIMEIHE